jgi:hypothetical protein
MSQSAVRTPWIRGTKFRIASIAIWAVLFANSVFLFATGAPERYRHEHGVQLLVAFVFLFSYSIGHRAEAWTERWLLAVPPPFVVFLMIVGWFTAFLIGGYLLFT